MVPASLWLLCGIDIRTVAVTINHTVIVFSPSVSSSLHPLHSSIPHYFIEIVTRFMYQKRKTEELIPSQN